MTSTPTSPAAGTPSRPARKLWRCPRCGVTIRRTSTAGPCPLCSIPKDTPATSTPTQPTARPRGKWLLPEDGIVDEIAVAIAASGVRPVRLTHTERRLAAAVILARRGGTPWLVSRRLRMSYTAAVALAASLAAEHEGTAA